MKYVLVLTLSYILFVGCKKDKCNTINSISYSHDTIYPHAYFPAYPGSYWVYNDNMTIQVEPDYIPFKLIETNKYNDCKAITKEEVLLPKIGEQFISYDRFIEYFSEEHNSEYLLFSDQTNWQSWQDPESKYTTSKIFNDVAYSKMRTLIGFQENLIVNSVTYNDIMVIEELSFAHYSGTHLTDVDTFYYAKNVGIIRQLNQHYSSNPPFAVDTFDLTNYLINH